MRKLSRRHIFSMFSVGLINLGSPWTYLTHPFHGHISITEEELSRIAARLRPGQTLMIKKGLGKDIGEWIEGKRRVKP